MLNVECRMLDLTWRTYITSRFQWRMPLVNALSASSSTWRIIFDPQWDKWDWTALLIRMYVNRDLRFKYDDVIDELAVKSRRLFFVWLSVSANFSWWADDEQIEFIMTWWVLLWPIGLHAVEKVFWWCRGERGKSGTIFLIWLYFLNFQFCSTKQQQILLYCINHFDTKKWLIYLLKQDKNAQTALWSLCHSCPGTTWGKIGTSAPGATLAPFSV